ncbi:deoxyguanosine triphosphate triphosphohydrolase [Gammaproteobacteria bacterium]|nr:deoxyguanosine triphosphate triphosphohydrolase [Gammaproteobacteria bacterium]
MQWQKLLNNQRLGLRTQNTPLSYRSAFQQDFDRLVFSAAFRRLQDKTQVFPLAQSDYVRTRLTHSLEVSSVARSLGTMIGEYLVKQHDLPNITPQDVGSIIAASALAHDIGNPPFGHAGEEAISRFFKQSEIGKAAIADCPLEQKADFLNFEGNAQGFRLLTKLQNSDNNGGLQLTLPTIGGLVKYPRPSLCFPNNQKNKDAHIDTHIALKKFNYFQAEKSLFIEFAENSGLKRFDGINDAWHRHPLAFLLEAADDICYRLIDCEDAYRLGILKAEDVIGYFSQIIESTHILPEKIKRLSREKDKIEYLRAFSIGVLIDQVIKCFIQHEKAILRGECHQELLALIPAVKFLDEIKAIAASKIYNSAPVLEVGIAGFEVLNKLLEAFVGALSDEALGKSHTKSQMIMNLLPDQFLGEGRKPDEDPYIRNLKITDFLSGMTDTYAVRVFQNMSGRFLKG